MRYCVSTESFNWQTTALSQFAASQKLTQLWMELRQGMSDEFLACQQPFNTLPKLPTDRNQDLRPNLPTDQHLLDSERMTAKRKLT
jgi:hypothetical protein